MTAASAPAGRARRPQLPALLRRPAAAPVWARVFGGALLVLAVLAAAKGPHDAAQTTVNGIVTGTYFALGAVGLALVFGVLRLVNFAHGGMLTVAAYIAKVSKIGRAHV